jgi:hypothetical protein
LSRITPAIGRRDPEMQQARLTAGLLHFGRIEAALH